MLNHGRACQRCDQASRTRPGADLARGGADLARPAARPEDSDQRSKYNDVTAP